MACGETAHVVAAGQAAVDGPPMREDALFRIASITKPMTAAVVLSLIEDGRLHFGDAVDPWLPELADRQVLRRPDGPLDDTEPAHGPVTVRDLLTFTWGFGMQGAMFTAADVRRAADPHRPPNATSNEIQEEGSSRGSHRRPTEDHLGLPGVQAPQLHHQEEPAQRPRPARAEEVLPPRRPAHAAPRDALTAYS